jgi:hypothetical protein
MQVVPGSNIFFEADYPNVIILGFTQYLQYESRMVHGVNTQSLLAESISKQKINK